MDFGKRTLAPLLLQWWAEASMDLTSTEIIEAFERGEVMQAFDPAFQVSALRHSTSLLKNTPQYGEWYDLTDSEEADPSQFTAFDDVHYAQEGDSDKLHVKDLSGDLNADEQWAECLRCLNIADVAKNVDGTAQEVGVALGCDFDCSKLETLADVSGSVGALQEFDYSGLFPPLVLLFGCMIQMKEKARADIKGKLRTSARRVRTRQRQDDACLEISTTPITAVFQPMLKPLSELRGRKAKRVENDLQDNARRELKKPRIEQAPTLLSNCELVITQCVENRDAEPTQEEKLVHLGLLKIATPPFGNCCPLSVAQGFGSIPTQETSDTYRELAAEVLYMHSEWREHFDYPSLPAWKKYISQAVRRDKIW
eukprot:gene22798-27544_t